MTTGTIEYKNGTPFTQGSMCDCGAVVTQINRFGYATWSKVPIGKIGHPHWPKNARR